MIKKILRIIGIFLYLVVFLVSGVTLIKPGSAIYYAKFNIQVDDVTQTGENIECPLSFNEALLDVDTLLVREDDTLLERVSREDLSSSGPGVFAVENTVGDSVVLHVNPISEMNISDDEEFLSVLVRPFFVTSPWILAIFIFLSAGLVLFICTVFIDSRVRKITFGSIFGIFRLFVGADEQKTTFKSRLNLLKQAAVNVVLVSFLYVLMEWIFFVTKYSFLDVLNFGGKLGVLFTTGLVVSLLALLLVLIIFLLDCCFSILISPYHRILYSIPTGLLWACLGLILMDNFTYTVFGFGIVTSQTVGRIIYAVGFIGLFVYSLIALNKRQAKQNTRKQEQLRFYGSLILLSVMIVFGVLNFNPLKNTLIDTETDVSAASLPNIILISNDGLNAANMSVYGYERETTPFLEDLAEISLVMENNFTNANSSTGSDTALLTGKLPFETRVLYPPNTLQGSDMYEHLPGILKRYDYRTVSFAVEHYVDVNVINFKNAFDLVNGKENQYSQTSDRFSQYGYSDTIYFISTISGRILDRVQHIFLIKDMQNVFAMVTEGMESSTLNEEIIFDRLIKNLNDAQNKDQPLFAHIHLISTHGPIFTLTSQAFSAGQEQDEEWLVDFYDDAILNYDEMIREFVEHLQENGLYDNTILVFYSDHGHKWSVDNKIPLIIHFPHDQYSGSVSVATQNLDIAPTLLDYLGIEQPSWMSGESLLGGLDRNRIIYSAMVKSSFVEAGNIVEEKIGPPFYQFGYIGVIQCQRFYKINLQDLSMKTHDIVNFSDPCVESELLSAEEIWENAGGLLSSFGFILPDDW